jgi:hypothetical protein
MHEQALLGGYINKAQGVYSHARRIIDPSSSS